MRTMYCTTHKKMVEVVTDDNLELVHPVIVNYEGWFGNELSWCHGPFSPNLPSNSVAPADSDSNNTMLYVGGNKTAFRCQCGANVFSKLKDERGYYWECHGCHATYRGETDVKEGDNAHSVPSLR